MRRKIVALIAALLTLCLLSGCAQTGAFGGTNIKYGNSIQRAYKDGSGPISFDEIEYVRPDLSQMQACMEELETALGSLGSLRNVTDILDKCFDEYYNFITMYYLADIRSCQDTTDSYYAQEYAWCGDNLPSLHQYIEDIYYMCGTSRLADELENSYFWAGFAQEYADDSQLQYSSEIVELMQRENALLAEYRALRANPTILHSDGTEVDYFSYLEGLYGTEYSQAMSQYYNKYNEEFARIYIELVKLRRQLAQELGYEDYEHMQFEFSFERDYSPEEAGAYIRKIKEQLVPFYLEISAGEPYAGISFDRLDSQELHRILAAGAQDMGGQVQEAFEFMSDYGYYDIDRSYNKAAVSFQTYLSDYEAPFLFLYPMGTNEDILSFSHEFGHYLDAYANYDAYGTVDLLEFFSQGMEYLMLFHLDGALSQEELDNLYRIKMMDTLELYVQQASFAEFESRVYSMQEEELSAQSLNDLSLELAVEYGYYDGEHQEYYAMSWMDISHFFESPFYIISYPVSNDLAMQIYELEQQQEGLGLNKYLEMLPREYEGLMETAEASGMESPFAPGRIEKIVQDLSAHLSWPAAA